VRAVVEAVTWTLLCVGVWWLTLSSITWQDTALAGAAGVVSAACAVGGRRLTDDRWRMHVRWLRWLAVLPVSVVADTAAVLAGVYRLRRSCDAKRTYRLPDREAAPTSSGRAALGALAMSASPASYVFDTDSEFRVLHVHTAGTIAPAWAQVNPTEA
jgi:hypothetical protein